MSATTYRIPPAGVPVILANGSFPQSRRTLAYLLASELVICCDGAVDQLVGRAIDPRVIVGDMDSISEAARARFHACIVEDPDQETNDLTKAINWAVREGIEEVLVLGADGKRLDHTIANAALVAEHCARIAIAMATDDGFMVPVVQSTRFACVPGQQVSIFSLDGATRFHSQGLRYELQGRSLESLWSGSLNEATSNSFLLDFPAGRALVYLHCPQEAAP